MPTPPRPDSGAGSQAGSTSIVKYTQSTVDYIGKDWPDPRDNLPCQRINQTPDFSQPTGLNYGGGLNPYRAIGYLREDFGGQTRPRGNFALYFMYNPTEIGIEYTFDSSQYPPEDQTSDQLAVVSAITNQSFSFTLFFDRTVEVWRDVFHPGTLMDQRAMERVIGIYDDVGTAPQSSRVRVFFGGLGYTPNNPGSSTANQSAALPGRGVVNSKGQLQQAGGAMIKTGYVTGLSITHTRFDRSMTPVHTTMQLTLQLIYNPSDTNISTPTAGVDQTSGQSAIANPAPRVRTIGRQVGT